MKVNDPVVVAAFRAALLHQGLVALLIFAALGLAWVSARVWLPGAARDGAPARVPGTLARGPAEPAGRRLLRIGFTTLIEHWDGTSWSVTPSPKLPRAVS